jgi:polyhydroxybutyrate depolymerase
VLTVAVNPAEALGKRTRTYRVHIPAGYQDTTSYALILYFHGSGGSAQGADEGSGFSQFADQNHFIVAYGQGSPRDELYGATGWASEGPIDYGINDVHYVSLMLDDLQSKLCIDAHRIFVTGISNGGSMTDYLAAQLAGRIAAAAPVAGNFYYFPGSYHPVRPVPILDIHGTADPLIPYQGIPTSSDPPWPLPPIPQWLQGWATRNGCQQGPTVFLRTPQVMGEQWTHCRANADVVHYRIEGGGHSWPRMLGNRTSLEVMWNFFQSHPLPKQS